MPLAIFTLIQAYFGVLAEHNIVWYYHSLDMSLQMLIGTKPVCSLLFDNAETVWNSSVNASIHAEMHLWLDATSPTDYLAVDNKLNCECWWI